MSTASYFTDNWSYQNAKPCSVLVGDSTDKFPASKATTLESANKSLSRPHQSSTSSASGKGESHSRPRRSIDGHASLPSVSSTDSFTVDVHELITSPSETTSSLVHGVSTKETVQRTEFTTVSNDASVFSDVGISINSGDLTINNTTLEQITTTLQSNAPTETTRDTTKTTTSTPRYEIKINTEIKEHHPPEIEMKNKNNVAYEPEDMQSDSFPSIYAYGVQKLQYLKLLTRLNEVNEELHIYPNDPKDLATDPKKYQYERDRSTPINIETATPTTASPTSTPTATVVQVTNSSSIEQITKSPSKASPVFFTTHNDIPKNEHVFEITQPPQSVTNSADVVNITSTTTEAKTKPTTTEPSTLNIATDSRTSDAVPSAKHVLINLTISADDANNDSYKPLYSLTVTVPTVGDSNEIPTVKITPMETEPTMPTNFNRPVSMESIDKTTKTANTEKWGGSCECSCPVCDTSVTTDDFYDSYVDNNTPPNKTINKDTTGRTNSTEPNRINNITTDETTVTELTEITPLDDVSTDSTTEFTNSVMNTTVDITVLDSSETVNDLITTEQTAKLTTESEIIATTNVPKCICPQVKPPPILILEGEVSRNLRSDNVLTIAKPFPFGSSKALVSNILIRMPN